MTIRTKLILLLLAPVAVLVYFGSSLLHRDSETASKVRTEQAYAEIDSAVSRLVHCLQKERGSSAGYLASEGTKFRDRLSNLRLESDRTLEALRKELDRTLPADMRQSLGTAFNKPLQSLTNLATLRTRVDDLRVTASEEIASYTDSITALIDGVSKLATASTRDELIRLVVAHIAVMRAKELAGIERATLSSVFAADKFLPGEYERLVTLIAQQETYFEQFRSIAPGNALAELDKVTDGQARREFLHLRRVALDKATKGHFGIDPTYWFDVATVRVDKLNGVENVLTQNTQERAEEMSVSTSRQLALSIVMFVAALSATLVGGGLIVHSIRERLAVLTGCANEIAEGGTEPQIPIHGSDEIGNLADAIRRIVQHHAGLTDAARVALREHIILEEQMRITAELEAENRRIQEANRLKSEFVANMSHELRTPLNSVIGFADLLSSGSCGPLSNDQAEYLGYIVESGNHLLRLINDVLDLAKVESGKLDLVPEVVDMAALVTQVTDVLRTQALQRNIDINIDVADLGTIMVDPVRFKQVLYNFLSNAIKFNRDGGKVWVRVKSSGPDHFRLEVQDTGVGIKREDLGRLFVEFQQLDASTVKRFGGTGLGLGLTRRIVELQGGTVGVSSEPGVGSTFFAELPNTPVGRVLGSRVGGGPRILVAENNAADRAWITEVLERAGYRVDTATSGSSVLIHLGTEKYAAITLDLALPDMSGWQLLKHIRASDRHRDVPVVIVSVNANHRTCTGFPVNDILTKPVRAGAVLDALEKAGATPDRKIMVLDDEEGTRRVLADILTRHGYVPLCPRDGPDALQHVGTEPLGAIILDLMMPGMDGFEFLDRLADTELTDHVPIIVLTAKDLTARELKGLQDHTRRTIQKGLSGENTLLARLQTLSLQPNP